VCAVHHGPWAERQACLREVGNLDEKHQIMEPNLVTGQTPFGVYTRAASQVEMSKTPQFLLLVLGGRLNATFKSKNNFQIRGLL
jgi:hypothetical protein